MHYHSYNQKIVLCIDSIAAMYTLANCNTAWLLSENDIRAADTNEWFAPL